MIEHETEQEIQVRLLESVMDDLRKIQRGEAKTGWGDDTSFEANVRAAADRLILISQRDYPNTFRAWMQREFDRGELRGIAEHGANTGWHHLIYHSDMLPIYDKYENELWDAVSEEAEEHGHDSALAFMAEWNTSPESDAELKSALVHYMAERTARELVDAVTLVNGDERDREMDDVLFVPQAVHDQWQEYITADDGAPASLVDETAFVQADVDKRGFFELADWIERHAHDADTLRGLMMDEYAVEDEQDA